MKKYYHLKNEHAQYLSLMISELDIIDFLFSHNWVILYKSITNKLISRLDIHIYQTTDTLDYFCKRLVTINWKSINPNLTN
jgi:hypothetical protein